MHIYELFRLLSTLSSVLHYSNLCVSFVWENSEMAVDYVFLEKVQTSSKKSGKSKVLSSVFVGTLTDGNM